MSRSRRPYLIRAIYEWACDHNEVAHMLVAAEYPGVSVPAEHVVDGHITLNISPDAVRYLDLSGPLIQFEARFGGASFRCEVPVGAVLAVFGRDSGEGIVFGEVEPLVEGTGGEEPPPSPPPRGSHLRVVK